MKLGYFISVLLLEHDCVVVPDFGGFIGNHVSAKTDPVKNKFSPPAKEISFNKNLLKNDGLLITRMVEEEQLTFEEVKSKLAYTVFELKQKLSNKEKVKIEKKTPVRRIETEKDQFIKRGPRPVGDIIG